MNKEKMKKILEQLRSKANGNNVAKASVEETAVGNVNVSMSVQGSTDEIRSELSADEVEISVNATNTIDGWRDSTDESDWTPFEFAPIGLFNGLYHACYFKINATAIKTKFSISNNDFKCGRLALTFSNESSGMKVFDFYNVNGECVGSWWQEISIMDVYDESNDWVELIVVPANGCTGMIIVAPTDFTLIYTEDSENSIMGISITTPPNKKVYLVGETFDPLGMVVTATYSDGSTAEVTGYYSPDRALTASDTSITISYTESGVTRTATQEITVDELKHENAPYVRGSSIQKMDIHIPKNVDGTYKTGLFPAVITIHGGNWTYYYTPTVDGEKVLHEDTVTKGYYDYMKDFITNTCGCVHVNINYRPLYCELTIQDGQIVGGEYKTDEDHAGSYENMLEDIQSVISYLQNHADIYHINPDKIALMGWSAGGHLALLYAYKAAKGDLLYGNKIQLVISEAGPTDFTTRTDVIEGNAFDQDSMEYLFAKSQSDDEEAWRNKLRNGSPIAHVNGSCPYTILAYGKIYDENNNLTDTDGAVPYSQAQALETQLSNNGVSYNLYTLNGVNHNQFGEGSGKVVYPNTTYDNEWGVNEIIDDYYDEISSKLQELARQED